MVTATTTLVALGSVITSTALARPPHVHGAWGTACLQNIHQDEHDGLDWRVGVEVRGRLLLYYYYGPTPIAIVGYKG